MRARTRLSRRSGMLNAMSAYQDLMTALATRRPDQSAAEDERVVLAALRKHARELAQRQRNWDAEAEGYTDPQMAVYAVANLVDPEGGDNGADSVRPGEEPEEDGPEDGGHDFQWGDDRVQRCTRCTLPHSHWAGGPCPGPKHPFKPGEYV